MEVKKALYISQEIFPYVASTPLAEFCRTLPQSLQERKVEVRTFMPKYGSINERRNQLHEVLRLSGVNIPINDIDHPLIIKVATLQPSRLQVYFIDNEDFFFRHASTALEINEYQGDNDERITFFALGVLETARKLRWYPEIIQCTGWATAIAPLLIRTKYADDPAVKDSKLVFTLFNDKFEGALDPALPSKLAMLGIPAQAYAAIDGGAPIDHAAICHLAIDHADAIAVGSEGVDPELIAYAQASGKPFLPYSAENQNQAFSNFYSTL